MKFYGTMMCPDTVYADKILRENNINVEYVDIVANMKNLKEFLALRDSREEFASIRENGKAGVPTFLLDDGSIEFDVHKLEGVAPRKEEDMEPGSQTCSIDGGGC